MSSISFHLQTDKDFFFFFNQKDLKVYQEREISTEKFPNYVTTEPFNYYSPPHTLLRCKGRYKVCLVLKFYIFLFRKMTSTWINVRNWSLNLKKIKEVADLSTIPGILVVNPTSKPGIYILYYGNLFKSRISAIIYSFSFLRRVIKIIHRSSRSFWVFSKSTLNDSGSKAENHGRLWWKISLMVISDNELHRY